MFECLLKKKHEPIMLHNCNSYVFREKKYKKFQIVDEGFKYKDQVFGFEKIKHLHFNITNTMEKVNFVEIGEAKSQS